MPVALVLKSVRHTRRHKEMEYTPTFSGTYPTGGDTVDLTGATNPSLLPGGKPGQALPESLQVIGASGGDGGEMVIGTTNANHKLKLFSAANTELANAAYNAALTGDANIRIIAIFPTNK